MNTWLPDKRGSLEDRLALAVAMRGGTLNILTKGRCHEAEFFSGLKGIESLILLHPLFFEWYFMCSRASDNPSQLALIARELPAVLGLIQKSRQVATTNVLQVGAAIDIEGQVSKNWQTLTRAASRVSEATGAEGVLTVIPCPTQLQRETIQAAFLLLGDLWPEVSDELQESVQQLFLLSESWIESFADFHSHGAVFIRQDKAASEVTLAEHILHEGTHVRLNTVIAVTRLFLNGQTERYSSPLRSDLRPMLGVFHQMFVLCRTARFYSLMAARSSKYQERLDVEMRHLAQAVQVVTEHAELTADGKAIMQTVVESAMF